MSRECKFPIVLKNLLKDNHVTQAMLADKIGVTPTTVGGWVTRRTNPTLYALMDIAAYFHVSLDYLVYGGLYD